MSGLRDLNKARRRDAILDAAVVLLGQRRSDEVSTEEIAALAGVAPATVYNLVGTRDDVVQALVARVMSRLTVTLGELDPSDPIRAAEVVVDQTVAAFVADSHVYRQVVAIAQRSSLHAVIGTRPSDLQVDAMRRARDLGVVRDDLEPEGLGRQVFLSYVGAMTLWSAGRLDDHGFAVAARHGLAIVLAAAATDAHRARFLEQVQRLGIELEQRAWHRERS